ncbi:MAG: winged helix-turn-helix transcriptional regulator [Methanomassiliicoccales archaeon]|nr:MAG: winged helix-turn-helix transcriptional regulator [Methanomassiliicoccales archaeon]
MSGQLKGINLPEQDMMPEERRLRVELDKKALYALASDSRLEILKALTNERRTLAQLSEALNADKAGVLRHLKKLEEGGLVTRTEDHGFIYYSLTWKARDLISPGENTKIIILISSVFVLLLATSLVLFAASSSYDLGLGNDRAGEQGQSEGDPVMVNDTDDTSALYLLWAVVLLIPAGALAYMAYVRHRKPRQKDPELAESWSSEGRRELLD